MKKQLFPIAAFVMLCGVFAGSAPAAHSGAWPLQERIDEIAAKGGGTLVLTAGVYRTGAIFFKPGVNLHLEKGVPKLAFLRTASSTDAMPRSGTAKDMTSLSQRILRQRA